MGNQILRNIIRVQIYRLNIINKFKPIINSGSLVKKHLATKFKVIDSIITKFKPKINSDFVVSI